MFDGCIAGCGIDLVEVQRVAAAFDRWGERFRNRIFTAEEQAYCDAMPNPILHYAARWAAKEAVAKAFGTGIGAALSWLDIEVKNQPETGMPFIRLSPRASSLAKKANVGDVLISLTHTDHYAAAQAILAKRNDPGNSETGRLSS